MKRYNMYVKNQNQILKFNNQNLLHNPNKLLPYKILIYYLWNTELKTCFQYTWILG